MIAQNKVNSHGELAKLSNILEKTKDAIDKTDDHTVFYKDCTEWTLVNIK